MDMKTFNKNFEVERNAKTIRARAKNPADELPEITTADGAAFDSATSYYFFDDRGEAVRQTAGMRRDKEFLCSFGLKIVEISKLRAVRDDALADGQNFFRSQIENFQTKIKDFELQKSNKSRDLKSFLMARDAVSK